MHRDRKYVHDMVKDVKLLFENGYGSQPAPSKNIYVVMWMKKSIFWKLHY